jgi:hypothetical protein
MTPEFDGMVEPEITINGTRLSFGQAMTVRVAIESFASSLSEMPAKERTGIFRSYQARIIELRELYMANQPRRT